MFVARYQKKRPNITNVTNIYNVITYIVHLSIVIEHMLHNEQNAPICSITSILHKIMPNVHKINSHAQTYLKTQNG